MRPVPGLSCRIVNIEQLVTIGTSHETTDSTESKSATYRAPQRCESMASESRSTHGFDPVILLARLMHSLAHDCSY